MSHESKLSAEDLARGQELFALLETREVFAGTFEAWALAFFPSLLSAAEERETQQHECFGYKVCTLCSLACMERDSPDICKACGQPMRVVTTREQRDAAWAERDDVEAELGKAESALATLRQESERLATQLRSCSVEARAANETLAALRGQIKQLRKSEFAGYNSDFVKWSALEALLQTETPT